MTAREERTPSAGPDAFLRDPFLGHVAVTMVQELPALTDELVQRVLLEDPFYSDLDAPTVARRAATEGVPVAALLRVYRLGAQVIWEHLADHRTRRHGDFDMDSVLDGAAVLLALVNSFSSEISQVYDETATDRFRRHERERTLLVDGLLEGRAQDLPCLADVARILDLPEQAEFVVVIAENPAAGTEGLIDIDQALCAHSIRSAWRLRSHRQIGIVVTSSGPIGPSMATLKEVVAGRASGRVGISPIHGDLASTASCVSLADLALGCLPPGTKGVALFDDHPIGTLVAQAPDLSDRIVNLVLGPLLALDDDRDVLVETLAAWIAEGGSTTRAATRMYCHRNTIRNRLQRIETLINRSMADPTALAEICIAMKGLALRRRLHH